MFKLVRIDDDYHREIELKDGKQVIGRDHMLGCDDKRVSRQHAEFETTVDSVYIKTLHLNPCFFVKKNMADAQILKQNTTVRGYHGDQIAFLPDKQWYSIQRTVLGNDLGQFGDPSALKALIQKILTGDKAENAKEDREENAKEDREENAKEDKEENEKEESVESALTDNGVNGDRDQDITDPQLNSKSESDDSTQCYQPKASEQSPGKRCYVKEEPTSPVDVKKVKIEKEDDGEIAQSSGNVASTSNNSSASRDSSDQQRPKRERCMYGKDCYRRNPQHKAQFSHPGDADWGEGKQGECPYGYACARRDPRHWRDHSHPYGMQAPPPPGIKKKRTHIIQRNGNVYYINANIVNFYDDHFEAEDTDGESVDYDYEFD